ncbi:3-hydroxybutyryl-CoA dehydrogenase [Micromonospora sp. B11E3]|uniref:3-hydroxybutyryl-CoA dehydrogenase n=1 Tax=Micromonospora sp. B11E3 TaxID=3153562 RepID=UPI00325CB970
MSGVERVGVVGCGQMGAGIAEACALAGLDVVIVSSSPESSKNGRARLERAFARAADKSRITADEAAQALDRIAFETEFDTLADRHLVVETVVEDEPTKLRVLQELDRALAADALIASNTSSIPIARLARATGRPGQVVGTHFFYPVPVMPLVELTGSLLTAEQTCARTAEFLTERLGKTVIRTPDRAGFVVNVLFVPYLMSAMRMLESGFASAADIDAAMVARCGHPMGPLALADMIGLDTLVTVADSLYAEFQQPLYAAPPLLRRMVESGWLGRKSGRGFHVYP